PFFVVLFLVHCIQLSLYLCVLFSFTNPRLRMSTLFPYTTLFRSDGVNATPLPTVNTTGYIDHAAFLGTINPDTNKISSVNSRERSEERFSRNAETDLVCRLLLEKKKKTWVCTATSRHQS